MMGLYIHLLIEKRLAILIKMICILFLINFLTKKLYGDFQERMSLFVKIVYINTFAPLYLIMN